LEFSSGSASSLDHVLCEFNFVNCSASSVAVRRLVQAISFLFCAFSKNFIDEIQSLATLPECKSDFSIQSHQTGDPSTALGSLQPQWTAHLAQDVV
jgi:hypothetical protein